MPLELITPDWPAPPGVRALCTTRHGGVSAAPWDSLNLGDHVGDSPTAVAENRRRLGELLPAEPVWLNQVHGTTCLTLPDTRHAPNPPPVADAACTRDPGVVCAVLTADCLPLLLCDAAGSVVAAAHAGWRGLAAGIIEATVTAMQLPGARLLAWLGPAIGPDSFEVGDEVRATFVAHDPAAAAAFTPRPGGKWHGDLYRLARQRLAATGVTAVHGGKACTLRDADRYYSYRRDGVTGRMASLIWIA